MELSKVALIGVLSALASSLILMLLMRVFRKKDAQIQKEQDDYIAMLVHDIRAPLSVIKGAVDIILHEAKNLTQEDISKLLNQVKDTADDLLGLVSDILDVSKIESGKFEIRKVPADLNLLLQSVSDKFLSVSNQSNIKIKTNLDASLPKVPFDADKIERVLNNLLSNSLKFTPDGGEITVGSKLDGILVRISIADTGIGVTDAMKVKLFHKFVQAGKTSKSEGKGTGLGLTISREIVELHKGKIWIEDNKPIGSIFVFTLPLS